MTKTQSIRAHLVLGALAAAAWSPSSFAQVSQGGFPEGLLQPIPTVAPSLVVPPPDVAAYLAEDEDRGHRPLRYGALIELDADLENGEWITLRDGSRIWRLTITSPGAHSLAVEFDAFRLPRGGRMYVYDVDYEGILGAYTSENRHEDGTFVFEPFPGDELTLEINLPAGAADPVLDMRALIYDYRDLFGMMDGSVHVGGDGQQTLGACLIDVNCPQGDAWESQKRATVRTLSGGSLCSAALLNNTANDETRYVLTANHCGQGTNTVFLFKYQRANCGSGSAPTNMTVSGATLLTTNAGYDNRFMRINNSIPDSYEPYYAGWTRSTSNATMAFAMGHPSGGPKKISIDNTGTSAESDMWRVQWHEGTLEGGSSGGPLFDQNGRVKGPACCVNDFICNNQISWFGRFDRFYNDNNLAQWLDPLGQNPTTLNGFDPFPTCPPPVNVCFSAANSVGPGAFMGSFGSQVRADNDFHLMTTGCPPNAACLYYYSQNQALVPFGDGWRCIGSPSTRLPVFNINVFGDAVWDMNLNGTQIDAGETWYFQLWYRNPAFGGTGFNLSDALEVPFCF